MKVFQGSDFPVLNKPVITVGFFDGVHLGHRNIIKKLKTISAQNRTDNLLITMWPHPATLVRERLSDRFLLSTLDEKLQLIENEKIDNVFVLNFDKSFSNFDAVYFLKEILVGKLQASTLVMGFNNTFGKGGSTVEEISKIANACSLNLIIAEEYRVDGKNISSSSVREKLLQGNIPAATDMLGYNYSFEGIVVGGYKIGRTLGFKTANILPCFDEKILPGNGVYAVEVKIENSVYKGIMNIGNRPTFDGKDLSLEVHIFDFEENIYGEIVTIRFFKKLRNEIKFSNSDDLIKQLNSDKSVAIRYFAEYKR